MNIKNKLINVLICIGIISIFVYCGYKFGYKDGGKHQFKRTMDKIYKNPVPLLNDLTKRGIINVK